MLQQSQKLAHNRHSIRRQGIAARLHAISMACDASPGQQILQQNQYLKHSHRIRRDIAASLRQYHGMRHLPRTPCCSSASTLKMAAAALGMYLVRFFLRSFCSRACWRLVILTLSCRQHAWMAALTAATISSTSSAMYSFPARQAGTLMTDEARKPHAWACSVTANRKLQVSNKCHHGQCASSCELQAARLDGGPDGCNYLIRIICNVFLSCTAGIEIMQVTA